MPQVGDRKKFTCVTRYYLQLLRRVFAAADINCIKEGQGCPSEEIRWMGRKARGQRIRNGVSAMVFRCDQAADSLVP
jgi:hypothetical protein